MAEVAEIEQRGFPMNQLIRDCSFLYTAGDVGFMRTQHAADGRARKCGLFFAAGFLLATLCVTLSACGAAWYAKEKLESHRLPKRVTLYVAMSPTGAEADSGLAAAVVDALFTDLTRRGYDVSTAVAEAGETPPVPRIELQIVDSAGGNTELRGAGQFAGVLGVPGAAAGAGAGIAGSSSITVDCYVVSGVGVTTFRGRISAATFGNTTGYDSIEAGEGVGLRIASTIAD